MDKPRNYYKNSYHHLYNRGANKCERFFDKNDYLYFLKRLSYYSKKYKIQILAYCLMPNHFHLFVKQITDTFIISQFISSFLNSYTKSINKKYGRSGTLFENKTKSKLINDEYYFRWIIKYILENPLKAKMVNNIDEWEYSNAKELLNKRNGKLTDINKVKSFFQSEKQMIAFLTDKKTKINYTF